MRLAGVETTMCGRAAGGGVDDDILAEATNGFPSAPFSRFANSTTCGRAMLGLECTPRRHSWVTLLTPLTAAAPAVENGMAADQRGYKQKCSALLAWLSCVIPVQAFVSNAFVESSHGIPDDLKVRVCAALSNIQQRELSQAPFPGVLSTNTGARERHGGGRRKAPLKENNLQVFPQINRAGSLIWHLVAESSVWTKYESALIFSGPAQQPHVQPHRCYTNAGPKTGCLDLRKLLGKEINSCSISSIGGS